MKPLVVDGSTALSFLLKDEISPAAIKAVEEIRKASAVYVPRLFWLEVINGLLMAERRRRASQAEISEALRIARSLPVILDGDPFSERAEAALPLARQHDLTIYDALYLELALRTSSRLATLDKALIRAASKAGVEVLN